jgi:hypothetical protein
LKKRPKYPRTDWDGKEGVEDEEYVDKDIAGG